MKFVIPYILIFIFFFYGSEYLFAQTIQGKVQSEDSKALIYASVLIKDIEKPNYISEFTIARTGDYKIQLKKQYSGIIIEVKCTGYLKKEYQIKNLEQKIYQLDFILKKDTVKIKEVTIVADKPAFIVKEDTVTYNVDAYKDGTERKVEEVIAKLPGIKVNKKTGEIKYKNRSVETVLLEDDDLFGYNYTLGTKNINIDMVEQIQAIENYSENPLLKGIEGGNKVVLNLVLKKRKVDISGSIGAFGGLFNDLSSTRLIDIGLLGITKNYKSYSSLSYNNIGMNNTPFDYFGGLKSLEQTKEHAFYADKIIPENSFASNIDYDRSNINNQYFGSHNMLFKIGKRIKIKGNMYYLKDKIKNEQTIHNLYTIEQDTFSTEDVKYINRKPILYRGDLNIKINTSKTSLLEYDLRLKQENINTPTDVTSNQQNFFNSILSTDDKLFKQELLFTQKISKKQALQITILQSKNMVNQIYQISPSVFDTINYNYDKQSTSVKKNYFEANTTLLGAVKRNKYSISTGWRLNSNDIQTSIYGLNNSAEIPINNNFNNLTYKKQNYYQTASFKMGIKRWSFTPAYYMSFLIQKNDNIIDDTLSEQSDIIFKPSLQIKYSINSNSFLLGKISYDKYNDAEKYIFENPVLISHRTIVSNIPSMNFSKIWYYSLNYLYNNMYNQLEMNAGVNYFENKGSYFSKYFINENASLVQYFFFNGSNSNLSSNFSISKYVSFLSSKISLSSMYSVFQYNNVVNTSDIRNNIGESLNANFSFKTGFSFFMNFSNEFTYYRMQSKNEDTEAFTSNLLENLFELDIKISKNTFATITTDYILPNLQNKQNHYLFIDFRLTVNSKNKRWEYNVIGKNLLNKNSFEQVQTTDYSIYTTKTGILQRYVLLGVSYVL